MDKIGISSASWQSVVTSARTKVASVSNIQVTKIGKTTLNRMKSFETLQEQAKKILSDYKDFVSKRGYSEIRENVYCKNGNLITLHHNFPNIEFHYEYDSSVCK